MDKNFRKELEALINRHSLENGSNTPDFILADYLAGCLANFDRTLQAREKWYGRQVMPKLVENESKLEKLTNEIALKKVEEIRVKARDFEAAHCMEDELYGWFIYCVSQGYYDIVEAMDISEIVLSTSQIKFNRAKS